MEKLERMAEETKIAQIQLPDPATMICTLG